MQITEIIRKTSGVCGGYACVRNTRIPVWTLVSLRQQGAVGWAMPTLPLDYFNMSKFFSIANNN